MTRTAPTRQTRQRALIFEIVAATTSHPTAEWIHQEARRRMPRLSLGTVYRNLQILEQEGRIRAHDAWGRTTRYDADLSDHYHFLCAGCGAIFDVDKPEDGDRSVQALLREGGFFMTGHRLEFHGLCPDCARTGTRTTPAAH